ncbi:MAG TPA: hypothetical protein VII06_27845 [Chloroflexota bacterium]|jgi:hypothetical protein
MQLQRAMTILKGATVGGLLLTTASVAMPSSALAANGDYGGGPGCCNIIITPPSVNPPTVNPPVVTPPQVTTPPQVPQSIPVVPIGGGGRSSVSSGGGGSLVSVSPVSASVSPVSISARPAVAPPPPAPAPAPAPVSQVLGRTVEAPPEQPIAAVAPPLIEETAPRVVAPPPPPEEQVAGRTVQREVCIPGVGGTGPGGTVNGVSMGPNCGEVLGRRVPGPGLELARVLPKAGEGLDSGFAVWPPLALVAAALVLGAVGLAWPRRRAAAQLA